MVNLDDTRHCPVGAECESCGRLDELAVSTADTPAGVICMTVCDACELIAVHPMLSPAPGGSGGDPPPGWLPRGSEATGQPRAD
jgi:hypothetical protein